MQNNINNLINLYKNKDYKTLEKLSLALLKKFPNNLFILKALAIALKQNGKIKKSFEIAKKIVDLNPNDHESLYNLGNISRSLNKINDAENYFKKAVELNPKFSEAYNNLALIFFEQGKLKETENTYKKLININPNYAEAYNNLGVVHKELKNFTEAVTNFKKAISLKPNYAEAYNNLGIALRELNEFDQSKINYQTAIKLKPNYAEAYNNLGVALRELNEFDQSKINYQTAIKLKPNYAEAYFNLGLILRELGELEKSIKAFNQAINIRFNYPEAHNGLGVTLAGLGKLKESKYSYNNALKLKPEYAEAYKNLSSVYLLEKKFKKGFELLKWNWKIEENLNEFFNSDKPIWNNEKNSKVLIWREQGIGDEIMYSSMLKEMSIDCKKLIVYCDNRLIPIFKRSFANNIIFESEKKKLTDYDYHMPMSYLFKFFRNDLQSFKNSSKKYLNDDTKKTFEIKNKLKMNKITKNVGISWKTFSKNKFSNFRNISLEELTTNLNDTNVRFINLQYGEVNQEILDLKKRKGIDIFDINTLDKKNDIDGLASLVSACDIIITIDNFLVHLAGALGINTKLLLPFIIHMPRWGLIDEKSYLHNSVTLFRQQKLGDWSEPLSKIKKILI